MPAVAVPEVVWERSTRKVLTLQDVTAIKISDVAPCARPASIPSRWRGLRDDDVHPAVPHGLLPRRSTPGQRVRDAATGRADAAAPAWTLTFIDFGMMGTVDDAAALGAAHRAAGGRGPRQQASGPGHPRRRALLPGADTRELERAYAKLFARFGGMGSRSCARSIRASSATSRRSSAMSCGPCRSSCRRTSC
jgi:hypothetical protein